MSNTPITNIPREININDLDSSCEKYNLNENEYKIKLHPHQLTLLQACINIATSDNISTYGTNTIIKRTFKSGIGKGDDGNYEIESSFSTKQNLQMPG